MACGRGKPGRLWAVRGRPRGTDNHQQSPVVGRCDLDQQQVPQAGAAVRHFLRNKKQEWEEYRSEVTAFELRKNLPVL
ncbi:hypothetical protein OG468_13250 [Streptomyces zaomyceticus]